MNYALIDYWKQWDSALDPWYEIPDEAVGVLYAPRADGPADRIAQQLLRSRNPSEVKLVLCGARGSGKSTELIRLANQIFERFYPIRIDLASVLPDGAGTLAVLSLLSAAALATARRVSHGERAEESLAAAKHLTTTLAKTGIDIGKFGELVTALGASLTLVHLPEAVALAPVAAAAGAALAVGASAVRAGTHLLAQHVFAKASLTRAVPPDRMEDAKAVADATNRVLAALQHDLGRPVLLLAEGLDRVDDLDKVRAALAQPEILEPVQSPMIFTGPVQLRHSPAFNGMPGRFRTAVLHNIAVVVHKDDAIVEHEPGIQAILEIYRRRAAHFKLPAGLISEAELRVAARMSSGIPREFFALLHEATEASIERGQRVVSSAELQEAIRRRRHVLQLVANAARMNVLVQTLLRGTPPAGPEVDDLLYNNYFACYPNGDLWFRPHEILVEWVESYARTVDRLALSESSAP